MPVSFGFHPYLGLSRSPGAHGGCDCRRCGASRSMRAGFRPERRRVRRASMRRSESRVRRRLRAAPTSAPFCRSRAAAGASPWSFSQGYRVRAGLRAAGQALRRARADDGADERAVDRPRAAGRRAGRRFDAAFRDRRREQPPSSARSCANTDRAAAAIEWSRASRPWLGKIDERVDPSTPRACNVFARVQN